MSDYRQYFLELKCEDRLSVADAVVLEHRLGLTKAAHFVAQVDPWCYPHDGNPATIGVKNFLQCTVQSVVAKAAHTMRNLLNYTDASITDFLLFLLKKSAIDLLLFASPKYNEAIHLQELSSLQLQLSRLNRAIHLTKNYFTLPPPTPFPSIHLPYPILHL
jgi:hypothetical protein